MKLLKFSAVWCGPCKVMTNRMKPLEDSQPNLIQHVDIDLEDNAQLVETFKVRSVPTIVLVDDNYVELERWVGIVPLAVIQEKLESNSPVLEQ